MDSVYILIPIALLFCVVAIRVLFWAIDHRQFDDLDAAGQSILFDDDEAQASGRSEDINGGAGSEAGATEGDSRDRRGETEHS